MLSRFARAGRLANPKSITIQGSQPGGTVLQLDLIDARRRGASPPFPHTAAEAFAPTGGCACERLRFLLRISLFGFVEHRQQRKTRV